MTNRTSSSLQALPITYLLCALFYFYTSFYVVGTALWPYSRAYDESLFFLLFQQHLWLCSPIAWSSSQSSSFIVSVTSVHSTLTHNCKVQRKSLFYWTSGNVLQCIKLLSIRIIVQSCHRFVIQSMAWRACSFLELGLPCCSLCSTIWGSNSCLAANESTTALHAENASRKIVLSVQSMRTPLVPMRLSCMKALTPNLTFGSKSLKG